MALLSIADVAAFEREVAGQLPVVVDFWAPWCGPCKALTPVLEEMSTRYPEVRFLKVNADDSVGQVLAPQFGVASLPTLLIFKGGKIINKVVGNVGRSQLRDFIESGI